MVVALTNYNAITLPLAPFALEITACVITSFTMADLSPAEDKTYTIMDPALVWSLAAGTYAT